MSGKAPAGPAPPGPSRLHGPFNIIARVLLVVLSVYFITQLWRASGSTGGKLLYAANRGGHHYAVHHSTYRANVTELVAARSAPHYVLFTAGYRENSDGTLSDIPWCGDCGVTLPIIRDIVSKVGGTLLEVEVGTKEEWKSSKHPLKVDSHFSVRYLPTLVHWTERGPGLSISRVLNADFKVSDMRLAAAKFLNATAPHNKKVQRVVKEVVKSGGKSCGGC